MEQLSPQSSSQTRSVRLDVPSILPFDLEKQNHDLFGLLDSLPDACISIDADFVIEFVNAMAGRDIVAGNGHAKRTIWEAFPQFFDTDREQKVRKAMADRSQVQFQLVHPSVDGLQSQCTNFYVYPDEAHVGLHIVYRDASKEQHAEEKLQESLSLLSAIIDGTSNIVLAKDKNRRYLLANNAAATYFGLSSPQELVGHSDSGFFTEDSLRDFYERIRAYDDIVLTTGNSVTYEAVDPTFLAKGMYRVLLTTKSPLRDKVTGEIFGVVGISHDITERKVREDRERFLFDLTERTRTLRDSDDILSVVVQSVREFMGASRCVHLEVDDDSKMMEMRHESLRDSYTRSKAKFPLSTMSIQFESRLRAGLPVIVSDVSQGDIAKNAEDAYASYNIRSLINIPMHSDGKWVGILAVNDDVPRVWNTNDVEVLRLIADRAWLILEHARLFRESERRGEREAYLSGSTGILTASLNFKKSLVKLARYSVPKFADWCVVDLVDDDGCLECIAVEHVDPEVVALGWHISQKNRSRLRASPMVGEVMISGRPVFVAHVTQELVRSTIHDDEEYRFMSSLGIASGMIVPLTARGRVYGTMTLATTAKTNRIYSDSDLRVAEEIGRRAGLTIESSLLYAELQRNEARQRRIANTLQTSLILPTNFDSFSGIEVDAHYESALDEAEIGGDYGDVFRLDRHRIALLVGDCTGKGLEAARFVSECQFSVRAFLRSHPDDPAKALILLNEMLLDGQSYNSRPRAALTSLTIIVIDSRTGEAVISAGGAEPPVVLRANTLKAEIVPVEGSLIGVGLDASFDTIRLTLNAGDMIILTTDGTTEARKPQTRELYGFHRFVKSLERIGQSNDGIQGFAEQIVENAKDFAGGFLTDDSCVIVAHRKSSAATQ